MKNSSWTNASGNGSSTNPQLVLSFSFKDETVSTAPSLEGFHFHCIRIRPIRVIGATSRLFKFVLKEITRRTLYSRLPRTFNSRSIRFRFVCSNLTTLVCTGGYFSIAVSFSTLVLYLKKHSLIQIGSALAPINRQKHSPTSFYF